MLLLELSLILLLEPSPVLLLREEPPVLLLEPSPVISSSRRAAGAAARTLARASSRRAVSAAARNVVVVQDGLVVLRGVDDSAALRVTSSSSASWLTSLQWALRMAEGMTFRPGARVLFKSNSNIQFECTVVRLPHTAADRLRPPRSSNSSLCLGVLPLQGLRRRCVRPSRVEKFPSTED